MWVFGSVKLLASLNKADRSRWVLRSRWRYFKPKLTGSASYDLSVSPKRVSWWIDHVLACLTLLKDTDSDMYQTGLPFSCFVFSFLLPVRLTEIIVYCVMGPIGSIGFKMLMMFASRQWLLNAGRLDPFCERLCICFHVLNFDRMKIQMQTWFRFLMLTLICIMSIVEMSLI